MEEAVEQDEVRIVGEELPATSGGPEGRESPGGANRAGDSGEEGDSGRT
jgi:hypothetical protein